MTGAEHYAEAERLLAAVNEQLRELRNLKVGTEAGVAAVMTSVVQITAMSAQAHATLALANPKSIRVENVFGS